MVAIKVHKIAESQVNMDTKLGWIKFISFAIDDYIVQTWLPMLSSNM